MQYLQAVGVFQRQWYRIANHSAGGLGLDWAPLITYLPVTVDETHVHQEHECKAVLFMDYPGYGYCRGSPSPATILESTEKVSAFDPLFRRWRCCCPL